MRGTGISSLLHRVREGWRARVASRSTLGEDGHRRYREAIPGERVLAFLVACLVAAPAAVSLLALPLIFMVGRAPALLFFAAGVLAAWWLLARVQFRRRWLVFRADHVVVGVPGRERTILFEDVDLVELDADRNPWDTGRPEIAFVRINRERSLYLNTDHAEQCLQQLLERCPGATGVGLGGKEYPARDPARSARVERVLYERRVTTSRLALAWGAVVLVMCVGGVARKVMAGELPTLRAITVLAIALPMSVKALTWGLDQLRRNRAMPVPPLPTDLVRERVQRRVAEAAAGLRLAGIVGMLLACLFLGWPWIHGPNDTTAMAQRESESFFSLRQSAIEAYESKVRGDAVRGDAREGRPLFAAGFAPAGDPSWLWSLLAAVAMIYASVEMRRLRRWRLAVTACLIAVIPGVSPLLLLGVPAGIWCLVVLIDSDVRAAFGSIDVAES